MKMASSRVFPPCGLLLAVLVVMAAQVSARDLAELTQSLESVKEAYYGYNKGHEHGSHEHGGHGHGGHHGGHRLEETEDVKTEHDGREHHEHCGHMHHCHGGTPMNRTKEVKN